MVHASVRSRGLRVAPESGVKSKGGATDSKERESWTDQRLQRLGEVEPWLRRRRRHEQPDVDGPSRHQTSTRFVNTPPRDGVGKGAGSRRRPADGAMVRLVRLTRDVEHTPWAVRSGRPDKESCSTQTFGMNAQKGDLSPWSLSAGSTPQRMLENFFFFFFLFFVWSTPGSARYRM